MNWPPAFQQRANRLGRAAQHGPVPTLDDRPLKKLGVLNEGTDQLVVAEGRIGEPEVAKRLLPSSEHVARGQPRFGKQRARRRTSPSGATK